MFWWLTNITFWFYPDSYPILGQVPVLVSLTCDRTSLTSTSLVTCSLKQQPIRIPDGRLQLFCCYAPVSSHSDQQSTLLVAQSIHFYPLRASHKGACPPHLNLMNKVHIALLQAKSRNLLVRFSMWLVTTLSRFEKYVTLCNLFQSPESSQIYRNSQG